MTDCHQVTVSAVPHPFLAERIDAQMPAGLTISEILNRVQPDPALLRHAHVYIDGEYIPRDNWNTVRPKAKSVLSIRVVPQGGGGGSKNPLRTVLSIALLAATSGLGYSLAQAFTGIGPVSIGTLNISRAIVGVVGGLAINAIAPPPQPGSFRRHSETNESPSLFISGARNQAKPFGTVPCVLGKHRMVPPLAAKPYTETVGNDQYVRMLFCWGYGPLNITDLKIGDTVLSEFEEVEIETREGRDTDDPLTLFTETVNQEDISVTLTSVGGWETRTTDTNTDEISIDITLPRGLTQFDAQGTKQSRTVQLEVQYAPTGTSDWSAGVGAFKTVAAQSSAVITAPGTHKISGVTYHKKRIDCIVIDKATGAVSVLAGETQMGFKADGTPRNASVTEPVVPIVPSTKHVIAKATHLGATLFDAFVDERDTGLVGTTYEAAGDFAPTTNVNKVDLAAGGIKHNVLEITGKQTSAIRRSMRFPVANGQYDVRVKRITADSSSDRIFDDTTWTALRSITNAEPVNMPGVAVTALRIKATDQLNGVVDQLNGIVECLVPDWDGSAWVEQPSSNPAALFRHVLQGAGNARPLDDGRLDLNKLQDWHEDCAASGAEFNRIIDTEISVRECLANIAAAGRASPSVTDGKWSVVQDKAQTVPVQHFTPRNSFGFSGQKVFGDIPHAFRVRFVNRDEGWEQDERLVFDDGYDETNATKFEGLELSGVTDPEQVWRDGRYHIATARLRPEVYSFSSDIEHIVCTRGDLIRFTHDVPLVGLMSARVKSVTDDGGSPADATAVTLDASVTMEAGKSYAIRFRKSDGTSLVKNVVTSAGDTTTLTFETPFTLSTAPESGDLAMFGEADQESMELLVKSIEPQSDMTAHITCVDAAPAVHTADTGTIPAFDSHVTVPPELQRPPTPIVAELQSGEETLIVNADGSLTSRVIITLDPPQSSHDLTPIVLVREQEETDFHIAEVIAPNNTQISVLGLNEGEIYDIRILYKSSSGLMSSPVTVAGHLVVGRSGNPADVADFHINILSGTAHLSWTASTDIDLSHYKIRFTPQTSGASWSSSTDLVTRVNKTDTSVSVPAAVGSYLIKAVDTGGRVSDNASVIVSTIGLVEGMNVVSTVTESPSFAGDKTDVAVVSNALRLTGEDSIDDWSNLDDVLNLDIGNNGLAAQGTYVFDNALDLGAVFTSTLTANITAVGEDILNDVDGWDDVDDKENFDGSINASSWSARLELRMTDDNPAGSPTWSGWVPFVVGEYSARAFEWRIILESLESGITPKISGLSVQVDMADRVLSGEDLTADAAGETISFTNAFKGIPAIAIDGQSMNTGDYWRVTNKTASGFDLRFYDSTGSGVSRTFDYVAKGYGTQISI